jgi:hypothetical protein
VGLLLQARRLLSLSAFTSKEVSFWWPSGQYLGEMSSPGNEDILEAYDHPFLGT